MRLIHLCCAVILACSLIPNFATSSSAAVTTGSLLEEMTSMEGMTRFPSPAYTCKQFSSYDRKSKSPSEEWFANGDLDQYLRAEETANGKEHVMMDAAGPGAVVRIWSANPAGTIRIYLDGNSTPEIVAPMDELLGGKHPGLPQPIAGEYSKGWNLYFPIPYARHCKITSDKPGFYYHINYRTYETGASVESFKRTQLEALKTEIAALADSLANPAKDRTGRRSNAIEVDVELPPGEVVSQEFKGPSAITAAVLQFTAQNPEKSLRGIILRAYFDGEKCVEAPLGDFFGSAPGLNSFESLPLAMTKEGKLFSRWVMPFQETAVFELENVSGQPATLQGHLEVSPYRWDETSMHFHAGWRSQVEVPTRPMIDWNYMTAAGKGVFAGASFSIDNPVRQWWGEGDEKIYVDGEKFPSHFGTGTEDYYGYAWCWPGLFTHAYHSQSRCDGPANYGRTSVNRFHIIDRIPFQKSFKFDMELWHWHEETKVNMAVTTYWYARPGSTHGFKPISAREAIVREIPPYTVKRVPGAIEGEAMKILQGQGEVEPQDWENLSGDRHLWWHVGVNPGDVLALSFPVPEKGKYKVMGRFLTAKDYGIHEILLNGKSAGQPIDFYNPQVVPTAERDLGIHELIKGENRIEIKAKGANPAAVKAYMFGLDYLRLEKQ